MHIYLFYSKIALLRASDSVSERVTLMRQGMLTLSGAPSTTSLIGYYHLSIFGLLHLVHIS